jgi:hypothetical protein
MSKAWYLLTIIIGLPGSFIVWALHRKDEDARTSIKIHWLIGGVISITWTLNVMWGPTLI